MLRHHDDEDGQDGNRADVDKNLREADELRAQLQIEGRQSCKAERQGQDAMDQIAHGNRGHGSSDGDGGKDEEGRCHVRFDEFSNVVPTLPVTEDQTVTVAMRSAVTPITKLFCKAIRSRFKFFSLLQAATEQDGWNDQQHRAN